MGLSPAEKQRAYRERQKERAREAAKSGKDKVASNITASFSAYWSDDTERQEVRFIGETLASVGLSIDFTEDEDPECDDGLAGFAENRGSLGRAERAVGALLDSATALAGIINRFKIMEIDNALDRISSSDLNSAESKSDALKKAVELEEMKKLLRKEVRRSLPATIIIDGDKAAV